MIDFMSYLLYESLKDIEPEPLSHEEEIKLANVFNRKFGRGFINNMRTIVGKDEDGEDILMSYTDTAHIKARFTQRYEDASKKEITKMIKAVGIGAFKHASQYFEKKNDFSILVFSKAQDVGMYIKFEKVNNDNVKYNLVLVTVLPKGKNATSRSSDVKVLVESFNKQHNTDIDIIYID